MTLMSSEKSVLIRDEYDILSACSVGKQIVAEISLDVSVQTRVCVVVSELARNMILHAGSGVIIFRRIDGKERAGVEIMAVDSGPGIQDVEAILQQEWESGGENGAGLLVARCLMDEFEVDSDVGRGVRVTIRKWRK